MYSFPRASSNSTSFDHLITPVPFPSPAPLSLPFPPPHLHSLTAADHQLAACCTEFDSPNMASTRSHSHSSGSTSTGCSSYNSPTYDTTTTTQQPSVIQRSISSHSLHKNTEGLHCRFINEFLDMDTSSVRRVFSAGDLHRINKGQNGQRPESPLASESSIIIEGMSRACRYSPEEKKERIERYRTKRNQRNFTKKIKYACRKTLADSRPRIRGRFARNDELEKNPQVQWNHMVGEEDDEDDENWINYLESVSASLLS